MIILPTLFENKDEIEILSPFPKAIHTSNDIRAIILRQYPNVKSKHIIVSDPESNVALIVGDNDVYQGWIKVTIKKLKEIKMGYKEKIKIRIHEFELYAYQVNTLLDIVREMLKANKGE
ncbi:hypothetical protein [Spiroplasma endosymbiont of Dasysyrphus albostriatus]|uniref:hypothetical protein n=1 Tax=Spiroplasma endosymbiont of Dasysyrphus albostriatus TaxID=3066299 RepID=UPI0030D3E5B4